MNEETKAKIKSTWLKKVAKNPSITTRLRKLANDPKYKKARAKASKALWSDPIWKAAQLAKMAAARKAKAPDKAKATRAAKRLAEAQAKDRKSAAMQPSHTTLGYRPKRVITPEQKI